MTAPSTALVIYLHQWHDVAIRTMPLLSMPLISLRSAAEHRAPSFIHPTPYFDTTTLDVPPQPSIPHRRPWRRFDEQSKGDESALDTPPMGTTAMSHDRHRARGSAMATVRQTEQRRQMSSSSLLRLVPPSSVFFAVHVCSIVLPHTLQPDDNDQRQAPPSSATRTDGMTLRCAPRNDKHEQDGKDVEVAVRPQRQFNDEQSSGGGCRACRFCDSHCPGLLSLLPNPLKTPVDDRPRSRHDPPAPA